MIEMNEQRPTLSHRLFWTTHLSRREKVSLPQNHLVTLIAHDNSSPRVGRSGSLPLVQP